MKNKFTIAVAVILSAVLITSCTIEKRHYMSGYHVEWNKSDNKSKQVTNEQQEAQALVQEQVQPVQNAVISTSEENNAVVVQPVVNEESKAISAASVIVGSEKVNADNTTSDAVKPGVSSIREAKYKTEKSEQPGDDVPKGLLIVLCFLMPWLAVGLATDWDVKTIIINLLWSLTCIGGIIHALIVVNRET